MTHRLRRAFRIVWRERRSFRRTRDWLAHFYNGLVNRSPLRLPGKGGVWALGVRGIDAPVYVRQGSKDWAVLREVLLDGEYSFALAHLAGKPFHCIVDLGANIGMTICLWRQHFAGASVLAVEPAPENLDLCRRNSAGHGDAVRVIAAGVSVSSGRGSISRAEDPVLFRTKTEVGVEPVELLSMEDLLGRGRIQEEIDLLKCDIEGAERDIFAECRGWIGRVRWLLIEVHDGYRISDLVNDLAANGVVAKVVAHRPKREPTEVALLRLISRQDEI